MNQCTDKLRSLFTLCFDNPKVRFLLTFEIDFLISFNVYKLFYVVIKGKLHFPKWKIYHALHKFLASVDTSYCHKNLSSCLSQKRLIQLDLRISYPKENSWWNWAICLAAPGYVGLLLYRISTWSRKPSQDRRRLLLDIFGCLPLLWRFPIWPHDPWRIFAFWNRNRNWW